MPLKVIRSQDSIREGDGKNGDLRAWPIFEKPRVSLEHSAERKQTREIGQKVVSLGLVDVPWQPAGLGGTELRPHAAPANGFEADGFEHSQIFLTQFAFQNKLKF